MFRGPTLGGVTLSCRHEAGSVPNPRSSRSWSWHVPLPRRAASHLLAAPGAGLPLDSPERSCPQTLCWPLGLSQGLVLCSQTPP